jgi:hypothetical protein
MVKAGGVLILVKYGECPYFNTETLKKMLEGK